MTDRTLVWDLGGVVVRWEPPALVSHAIGHLAPDAGSAQALAHRLFEDFGPDGDWSQFDRGTLDVPGLVARMAARTGLAAADVRAVVDATPAHLTARPKTVALIQQLRGAGHRCVYLSNMPAPIADALDAAGDLATWFDGGVYSCRVGRVKPEPEIFKAAQRLLGLEASRTTLVDDRPANVEAARRAGWDAVLFTGAANVAAALDAAGWAR
ncbi:MAG: HAD family hydrolase [Kineosporiaceae bacterium]